MPALASDLRSKLEKVVVEARDTAEAGARAALEALAVHHHEQYPHMKPDQWKLRNQLRPRCQSLGRFGLRTVLGGQPKDPGVDRRLQEMQTGV